MKLSIEHSSNAGYGNRSRLSLPVKGALAAIKAYKILISPHFRGSCRFLPSCADYTAQAIEIHGLLRGVLLGVRRIARCHPLGGHGHDPVPLKTTR